VEERYLARLRRALQIGMFVGYSVKFGETLSAKADWQYRANPPLKLRIASKPNSFEKVEKACLPKPRRRQV